MLIGKSDIFVILKKSYKGEDGWDVEKTGSSILSILISDEMPNWRIQDRH